MNADKVAVTELQAYVGDRFISEEGEGALLREVEEGEGARYLHFERDDGSQFVLPVLVTAHFYLRHVSKGTWQIV